MSDTDWPIHEGATVVECPVCGFCMDEFHRTSATGEYDCPACAQLAAEAQVRLLTEALSEAVEFATEAYEYGCAWPIGLDTDAAEQRGGPRDTFIRNAEFLHDKWAASTSPVAREESSDER